MKQFAPHAWEFSDKVSDKVLRNRAEDLKTKLIQTGSPISVKTAQRLNDVFRLRPDIELRFWGHHTETCDLSLLDHLPNLQHFTANCIMQAEHVESVAHLPKLKTLRVGIFSLDNFSFLEKLPDSIETLGLEGTKSKRPSIDAITRFRSLRSLYLEGHSKNLEVIGELPALEDLTLRSIKIGSLKFVRNLPLLRSLDIKLGGVPSLKGLESASIRYLELWQVAGLRDISQISKLLNLEILFLQSLAQIIALPDCAKLTKLRAVRVQQMKKLKDFSGLQSAPALNVFHLLEGNSQEAEDLIPVLKNKNLASLFCGFSETKRKIMLPLLEKYGKEFIKPPIEFPSL
ncbi:MAG: hypothetical protein K1X75_16385 [Leptospirales bacterium]|nr:hypothetical protein [Leptospirales bacterium]